MVPSLLPSLSVAFAGSECVVRVLSARLLRHLGQRAVDAAEGVAAKVAVALPHVRHAAPREVPDLDLDDLALGTHLRHAALGREPRVAEEGLAAPWGSVRRNSLSGPGEQLLLLISRFQCESNEAHKIVRYRHAPLLQIQKI